MNTGAMSPKIDRNHVSGSATESCDGSITFYDDGPGDGVCAPAIDADSLTDLNAGSRLDSVTTGTGNVFSPVITNSTVTGSASGDEDTTPTGGAVDFQPFLPPRPRCP